MGVQYPACARRHNCLHLHCLILSFSPSPLQHSRHLYNKHRIPRTCVARTHSLNQGFLFLVLEEFGALAQPILAHQPTPLHPLDFVFPQHFYSFFPVSAPAVFLVCFLSLRFAPALNTSPGVNCVSKLDFYFSSSVCDYPVFFRYLSFPSRAWECALFIWSSFLSSIPILWSDFLSTFLPSLNAFCCDMCTPSLSIYPSPNFPNSPITHLRYFVIEAIPFRPQYVVFP